MSISALGMTEMNEAPPLELTPQEMTALPEDLVHYHTTFADLYYRTEQAHWGFKHR